VTDGGSKSETYEAAEGATQFPRLSLALLRARPEILFVPFAAVWLLVNVAPWGFGTGYLYSLYLAFTLQKSNVILPFTYAFAVLTFAALLGAGLRWTRLGWGRSVIVAGTVPFAGPGLFEIVFQEAGAHVHPYLFVGYADPYVMFSYGTWVLLGLTPLGWWRLTWRWGVTVAYSAGGFLAWIALGMPLVTSGTFAQLPAAYLLNITLKASFYLVFLLPVLEGTRARRPTETNPAVSDRSSASNVEVATDLSRST
jgi:hypothetical protein